MKYRIEGTVTLKQLLVCMCASLDALVDALLDEGMSQDEVFERLLVEAETLPPSILARTVVAFYLKEKNKPIQPSELTTAE